LSRIYNLTWFRSSQNSSPRGINEIKKTDIIDKLRQEIKNVVYKYIEHGIAELVPYAFFIDEAYILDIECYIYLSKVFESPLANIIILATNWGIYTIRIADIKSPHCIPIDLLDRLYYSLFFKWNN
jgi:RuvB-like protein 1 (pontin 52)